MVTFSKKYLLINSYVKHQNICESVLDLPYALLKLGNWLYSKGNFVKIFDNHYHKLESYGFKKRLEDMRDFGYCPDEIWFSINFSYYWEFTKDEIDIVRSVFPDSLIVVGGIYPTLSPEHAEKLGADKVMVGNIEEAKWFWTNHDLLDYKSDYDIILTSRGCINRCTYCASHVLNPKFETRDVYDVVDEIEYKVKHNQITDFRFIDDNILYNFENHFDLILKEISKRNLKITFSFLHSSDYRMYTEEVIQKLVSAGYDKTRLLISYESSNRDYLKEFNRRPSDIKDFLSVVKRLKRDFKRIIVFLFLGFPNQKDYDLYSDIILFNTLNVYIMFSPFCPIPKTVEFEKLKDVIDRKKLDLTDLEPMKFKIYDKESADKYNLIKDLYHDKLLCISDLFSINYDVPAINKVKEMIVNNYLVYWKNYYDFVYDVELEKNAMLFGQDLFLDTVKVSDTVLEIGSGSGFVTKRILNNCNSLDAIDVYDGVSNLSGVNFVEDDFLSYDFGTKKYDFIVDSGAISSIPHFKEYISKVNSLLNVGGKLSVVVVHKNSFFKTLRNMSSNVALFYRSYDSVLKSFSLAGFKLINSSKNNSYSELLFEKTESVSQFSVVNDNLINFKSFLKNYTFEVDDKLKEVLSTNSVMYLSTLQDERPFVRPMRYLFVNNLLIAYTTIQSSKIKQLAKNNNVAISIGSDYLIGRMIIHGKVHLSNNSFIKSYFWDAFYDNVFLNGTLDPNLLLLVVKVNYVDYYFGNQYKKYIF